MTGYSNPFLNTHQRGSNQEITAKIIGTHKKNQPSTKSTGIRSQSPKTAQYEFSPLKRAEARVDQAIDVFDFDIFQDIQSEQENFRVFQRFCLLLLIIHGELERVQQDKSDDFLKQLNVYSEVINIKQTIAENRF